MIYRSWAKTKLALLLIAEEQVGAPRREAAEIDKAREDAGFDALRSHMPELAK